MPDTVISYDDALKQFQMEHQNSIFVDHTLHFRDVGPQDVYNITAPFRSAGKSVIAGRVEWRDSEDSHIVFFEPVGADEYQLIPNAPTYHLQDPFVTFISGDLVLGGVEVYPAADGKPGEVSWRTVLLRGKDIYTLQRVFTGPDRMKDLRVFQLPNGRVGFFSRPTGFIGYGEVGQLEDLTINLVQHATLLRNFIPGEWGSANEVHVLKNGKLGVLGHLSKFSYPGQYRHYAASYYIYDPQTSEYTAMKLLATSEQFHAQAAKRFDLVDVVFPGGLIRQGNGKALLYAGVADVEAHCLEIQDPFTAFED